MLDAKFIYAPKKNVDDPDILLGVKTVRCNGNELVAREFYIGEFVSIADYMANPGAYNLVVRPTWIEKYEAVQGVGLVYFPQTRDIAILQEHDQVVGSQEELFACMENEFTLSKSSNDAPVRAKEVAR